MRRRTAPLLVSVLAVPALAPAPASSEGQVGDTLSLTGFQDEEKLDITVTKVVDPAQAEHSIFGPSSGKRLAAVQFRMKNTGAVEYTAPRRPEPSSPAASGSGPVPPLSASSPSKYRTAPASPLSSTR
jgi:hypothetical protein